MAIRTNDDERVEVSRRATRLRLYITGQTGQVFCLGWWCFSLDKAARVDESGMYISQAKVG